MLISRLAQIALALIPIAAFSQTAAQTPPYQPNPGKSGIDLGAMDTAVSPCTNFLRVFLRTVAREKSDAARPRPLGSL